MKRPLLLAALATVASTSVLAQSNVTIYGRLNTSVERQKPEGGDAVWALQNSSSRIGFKGAEDLGGGLKAGFQLEHGFNVDTGAQSQSSFWARQSEVYLGSSVFGTVRLGNFTSEAYYASADYVSMHNHDTGTSADNLYAYVGRNTNKVAYRAPEFVKGLSLEGAMSLKEAASTFHTYDLAANYDMGPLHLGFGYEKADTARQFALRALYELGDFTFGGYIQRDKDAFAFAGLPGSRTNVRLSGMYSMGPSEFHLNLGFAGKIGDAADSKATQYTLAYNYNLSKRTKVYAFYTRTNAQDVAAANGAYPDFSSLAFGVRHNF